MKHRLVCVWAPLRRIAQCNAQCSFDIVVSNDAERRFVAEYYTSQFVDYSCSVALDRKSKRLQANTYGRRRRLITFSAVVFAVQHLVEAGEQRRCSEAVDKVRNSWQTDADCRAGGGDVAKGS